MKHIKRYGRLTSAAVAVGLAGVGVLAAAGPAAAGTDGQQIKFVDTAGFASAVEIIGYNQNGEFTDQCFNVNQGSSTYIGGWWWVSSGQNVTIRAYHDSSDCYSGNYFFLNSVYVPYSQSSDWVTVTD